MKRTPLKRRSDKKILRDEVGALHREKLKRDRDNYDRCEICGRSPVNLGRFHIMAVGEYSKLEFLDENVLLTCWFPCHDSWHHSVEEAIKIKEIIKKLRGEDYREKFLLCNKTHESITMVYLQMLKRVFSKG